MLHRSVLLVILAWAVPAVGYCQAPARTHTVTVDDYFTQADLFGEKISPDGSHVAYVVGNWQESSNDRKSDLWVVETATGQSRKLTFDRANDRSPEWDPESRTIYFLGNRERAGEKSPPYDGKTQVWRVPVTGGTPFAVTRVEGGVERFALAPDGRSLYYVTGEKTHDDGPWKSLRNEHSQIEYGHGVESYSRVHKLGLDDWRTEQVYDRNRVIREMALSPDGRKLAMITTPDGTVVSFEGKSRVDVLDLASGKVASVPDKVFRKELPSPYGWLEHLAWRGDSQALAFNVIFDAYPSEVVVALDLKGTFLPYLMKRPEGVSLHGYGSPIAWRGAEKELCFLGDEKGRVRLYCTTMASPTDQTHTVLTPGDVAVQSFSFSKIGTRGSAVLATADNLGDVYLFGHPGAGVERLTKVNPQVDTWKLPQLSVVSWKGHDGKTVEGILELPPDYQGGEKLPLVVVIHGGPTTCSEYKLQYWIYGRTLLAAQGFAVLLPNYRGSTGYGDAFLTDLIGKENNVDVTDILSGVDLLVARGIADPERLAVSGWSNGGYLTNCIISRTDRFKAAISGAGIVDAVMEWGSNDEPAYAIVFKQGFPWNAAEKYHRASPTYELDKIRTPTLIHVGANDERCPPGHSRMLYRTLKEYLGVPTELLVYPGESHGLMKYNNRRAKMEWDLAWLRRYVLGQKVE